MSDRCWICGKGKELGVREIVTFRASDGTPEVTRVATCFECRAELIELHDAKERALTRVSNRRISWRAVDVAAVLLVLAAGMFIAAWAGWVGSWFNYVGIAYVLASPIVGLLMWWRGRSIESTRDAKWKASANYARLERVEQKLADQWEALRVELEARGSLTEIEKDERTLRTLEPEELAEPAIWKPHETPSYVERAGERSQRRALS